MKYYNRTTEQKPDGFDLTQIPFKFHLDNINSQFIRFYAFLDTSNLPEEDKPWLVLLTELWLQSPLKIDGKLVPLSDVISRRSNEALTFYNDMGFKGSTFSPGSQSRQMMWFSG